jgi:hypothetical protein
MILKPKTLGAIKIDLNIIALPYIEPYCNSLKYYK